MAQTDHFGPVDPRARLTSVDAARGFALFGVLLVNMFNFGAYSPEWTDTIDQVFYTVMHAVFETKSWRLFAMLFGFGIALQLAKAEALNDGKLWFYYRRVLILFLMGMAHAMFFDGDILMEYALLGLVLPLFRRLPTAVIMVLVLALMSAFPVGHLVDSLRGLEAPVDEEALMSLAELRHGHPYLGSLGDIFATNAESIPPRLWENLSDPESSLAILAMILLGFQIGRSRLVHTVQQHAEAWRRVFRWCAITGTAFAACEWILAHYFGYAAFEGGTATTGIRFLGDLLFAIGSTALALAYGSGIVLLSQQARYARVLWPFVNLGRMALTVYLMGTMMFTVLFYGYGFGMLYLLGPAATTAFALLFFAFLIIFSTLWLRFYRFGPMEWIWRSLTYFQKQPFRAPVSG